MGAIDWDNDDEVKGVVFVAVTLKKAKDGGGAGAKVKDMWARVVEVVPAKGGQKSNRYSTHFFDTKEEAQEGSGASARYKEVFTLKALQGHADVLDEDGEDSESDDGEAEEVVPDAPSSDKRKKKKDAQKANEKALRAALAKAGLKKDSVLARMRKAGFETVDEVENLAGAGTGALPEIAAAAELAPAEQAALGKYMTAAAAKALVLDKYMGADSGEDGEDGSDEEEVSEQPAKKGKAGKAKHPLMESLLAGVPEGEREEVAIDVLEGLCAAMGKEPIRRELKNARGSAEAKCVAMGFTAAQLKPAAPGGADEVSELVTRLTTGWEKPVTRGGRGGSAAPTGEGELAAVATGQQEPGVATALASLIAQPALLEKLAGIMAEEDSEKAVKAMAELGGDEAFAAILHKSGELKVPSGVRQTHGMLSMVHSVARMRQRRVEYVAGALRDGWAHLPAGADALAIAWKLAAGDVGGIDLAKLYGCEVATSMVGALDGGSKAPRGDATSDAMLVVMRGMAMLLKGYYVAHSFDETVAETFAGLQVEVVAAVQKGVHVAVAWKMVVDPFFAEVGRKWKEVGRLAGARPVLGLVAKEPLTVHALAMLREHAASCTPAVQASAADVKKLRSELEVSKAAVADLKRQVAAKGGPPQAQSGPGPGVSRAKWEEENPGKCFFWTSFQFCKHGKGCRNATQPGHPQ